MPRRSILSSAERDGILTLPDARDELIRMYTHQRSRFGDDPPAPGTSTPPRLRHPSLLHASPGILLAADADADAEPFAPLLRMVAAQIKAPIEAWSEYGQRAETRRDHQLELQSAFGFRMFPVAQQREDRRRHSDRYVHWLGLNVLFDPNSETTPTTAQTAFVATAQVRGQARARSSTAPHPASAYESIAEPVEISRSAVARACKASGVSRLPALQIAVPVRRYERVNRAGFELTPRSWTVD